MNQVSLVGRLTKDPELTQTQNGNDLCRFTVAVDRPYSKSEQAQKADFIPCRAWGKTAEFISRYFQKGKTIGLTGSMRVDEYEKNGQKQWMTTVNVDRAEFVGGRNEDASPAGRGGYSRPAPTPVQEDFETLNDAELPF